MKHTHTVMIINLEVERGGAEESDTLVVLLATISIVQQKKNCEAWKEIGKYFHIHMGKKLSIPAEAQIFNLVDKSFKLGIINMSKKLKTTMSKEAMPTMFYKIDIIIKEKKTYKY